MEQLPNARHQHHHAHKTVDHRGNARQHGHRLPHDFLDGFGCHFCQIHGGQKANRYAQQDCPGSAVDAGEDKGKNAVLRLRCRGSPFRSKEELHNTNFPDGRDAGNHQIHSDQQHAGHRHQSKQQENAVNHIFQQISFRFHSVVLSRLGFYPFILPPECKMGKLAFVKYMSNPAERENAPRERGIWFLQFAGTTPAAAMISLALAEVT